MYVVSPPSTSDSNYSHFVNTVMNQPAIEGVTVGRSVDAGRGWYAGTGDVQPGGNGYVPARFIGMDAHLRLVDDRQRECGWFSAQSGSKKVNVILDGIEDAAANCLLVDYLHQRATPYYVTSASWATHMAPAAKIS